MNELVDTTEMYLKTIFELEEEGAIPLRARIVDRLHQSGPTVSQTVARMQRDGLVNVLGDRHLELTEEGRRQAVAVMRKHRLAELLLVEVLGLEWEKVHAEACRWEHVISTDVERRIVSLVADASESPYGNPIPGLAEIGAGDQPAKNPGSVALSRLLVAQPKDYRVCSLTEGVQADDTQIALLAEAKIRPGETITASLEDDRLEINGRDFDVKVADHIFVPAP